MLKQVWIDVNTELPPDGWTGQIKGVFPGERSEKQCLLFQKKDPITGVENHFVYQYGIVDGKTGKVSTPGKVTHWLKIIEDTE